MQKMNIKKIIFSVSIVAIIICAVLFIVKKFINKDSKDTLKPKEKPVLVKTTDFTINLIKEVSKENKSNYLISPYNIEIALNMLRVGADGNTKAEIDKVIGNRKINDVSVPNIINVANAVFVKKEYQNNVKNEFITTMKEKYQSEILYDEFIKPDVINHWVNENTNGMIEKLLDKLDENFMVGLASALAIDVKWESNFECDSTISEEFTKIDNTKMNVEMMHQIYKYNAKYIKTDDAEGIIVPYRQEEDSNIQLEFVAILPNNGVNEYINSLTKEKLDNVLSSTKEASDKYRIKLSLPRFTYSYSIDKLDEPLKNLGIKDAFVPDAANFSKMLDIKSYVGQAIHKTYIELNEMGTKAAAVTFFGVDMAGIPNDDYELIDIKLNKPFIYMIREKNSGEVLFFGSVYEPNEWKGSTCPKDESGEQDG